jgi:hypothetical protein
MVSPIWSFLTACGTKLTTLFAPFFGSKNQQVGAADPVATHNITKSRPIDVFSGSLRTSRTPLSDFAALTYSGVRLTLKDLFYFVRDFSKRTFGFGFYYIQGFAFVLFIDACLTDDEPLWEPIEWSLVQTWILFIFSFA